MKLIGRKSLSSERIEEEKEKWNVKQVEWGKRREKEESKKKRVEKEEEEKRKKGKRKTKIKEEGRRKVKKLRRNEGNSNIERDRESGE